MILKININFGAHKKTLYDFNFPKEVWKTWKSKNLKKILLPIFVIKLILEDTENIFETHFSIIICKNIFILRIY